MRKHTLTLLVAVLFAGGQALTRAQQSPPKDNPRPLTRSVLLAMVSGAALPENIVSAIRKDGLAFQPDDTYRDLLRAADAAPSILSALDSAKATTTEPVPQPEDLQRLKQLADAGHLMQEENYNEAASELTAQIRSSFENAAGAFVMGELFTKQQDWQKAAAAYAAVLHADPGFPEAHTKASLVLIELGDNEDALSEANAALAITPDNPEAHKNAGFALNLLGKFDASVAEFKEALRLKPDYWNAHQDLGLLLSERKEDTDAAIIEYKKAIELHASEPEIHYDLALAYDAKGDIDEAIHEYRAAKALDPSRYDVRQNLGADLLHKQLYSDAAAEFSEMENMFPASDVCHRCMGEALYGMGRHDAAGKEYRMAVQLGPSDPYNHLALGDYLESENDPDGALKEYFAAQTLDPNYYYSYKAAGGIYIAKKDYADAIKQLKTAEALAPQDAGIHDLYGQALEATGQTAQAKSEFSESVLLDPNQPAVRLRYAAVLEKSGDLKGSLEQYRLAAQSDPSDSTQQQYKAAQQRFAAQLKTLKAEGQSSEASELKSSLRATERGPSISEQLDAAIAAGEKAQFNKDMEDALSDYKRALEFAEKLQPHDGRLPDVFKRLGTAYMVRSQYADASEAFRQQIASLQELHGRRSIDVADPLYWMGSCVIAQNDFTTGNNLILQSIQATQDAYGDDSPNVIFYMNGLAQAYMYEKQDAKAIPYLERTIKIGERLPPSAQSDVMGSLSILTLAYDHAGKPNEAESTVERLLTGMETQFGRDSPQLLRALDEQENLLKQLGRTSDAANVEKHINAIKTAAAIPNPN